MNSLKNDKNNLLISKIEDKIIFCDTKNKIQCTDFLSLTEQKQIEIFLKIKKIKNYFFTGCFEEAERKMLIIYPKKLENVLDKINLNEYIDVIRITIPNELKGKYSHRNYLGGIMKLGIEREKIGDILVDDDGADIIISPDLTKFILTNISELTRFNKSKIEKIKIEDIKKIEIKTQIIKITVASMRLDNIVSELVRCSRTKAVEIIEQERVLINYETYTKISKEVKKDDVITIRGKGRFIIKDIVR